MECSVSSCVLWGIARTIESMPYGSLKAWRGAPRARHTVRAISALELVTGPENPGHDRDAQSEKTERRSRARRDSHVRNAKETPAEAADEVHHRIEQRDPLPERRQHADRVERPAEEGE